MFSTTQNLVYDVNKEKGLLTNLPHFNRCHPDKPNMRIHADLFGPMLAAGRQHKYILCITDAFT